MISCPTVHRSVIRSHYDLTTVFYRLLWGPHIHHGLWEGSESPRTAQQHLTETLSRHAGLCGGERVLDVGCGMGGSSIHLARKLGCRVTGITVSPLQRRWATLSAMGRRVSRLTDFQCVDAEQVEFSPETFDVVWSIECTEHLFDKEAFFRRAAEWLRPGGRMAICAWLAGDSLDSEDAVRQVYDVCEGFFCPSLGTGDDYQGWMSAAGLVPTAYEDWTDRVWRTWEICRQRVARTGMRRIARWIDPNMLLFLDRFETILRAYQTGAMRYGCFIAHKAEDPPR